MGQRVEYNPKYDILAVLDCRFLGLQITLCLFTSNLIFGLDLMLDFVSVHMEHIWSESISSIMPIPLFELLLWTLVNSYLVPCFLLFRKRRKHQHIWVENMFSNSLVVVYLKCGAIKFDIYIIGIECKMMPCWQILNWCKSKVRTKKEKRAHHQLHLSCFHLRKDL